MKRLPNGNLLITHSNSGVIQEINASADLVQEINPGGLGYTVRRRTLYGPPPPSGAGTPARPPPGDRGGMFARD